MKARDRWRGFMIYIGDEGMIEDDERMMKFKGWGEKIRDDEGRKI
jgi:hypothetical protein